MTRFRWLLTATSISTLILAGVSAFTVAARASRGARSASGTATKITLEKFKAGKILATSGGFTIYAFTRDTKNHDKCVTISGCAGFWPPVTTKGKPVAGPGVNQSLLGTIFVKHVGNQVTYNGHPLYTYIADGGPHDTSYVNASAFGGRWPGVNAKGQEVK